MKKFYALILVLLAASLMAPAAFGQSLISGDIAGTVTDPSHAVVPGASGRTEEPGRRLDPDGHDQRHRLLSLFAAEAGQLPGHG